MHAECKIKNKNPKFYLIALLFLILSSALFVFTSPASAQIKIGVTCFRQDECGRAPYQNGQLSPSPDPSCESASLQHSQEAVDRTYIYNCYAQSRPYTLQVPLLGGTVTGLENYIARVFQFLISIAGVIAGIMIVYAGFKWLTAAGSPEKISDARRKIADASIGLILVLASYLILQTVNPALVRLQLPPVKLVRQSSELPPVLKCNPRREKFLCGGQSTEARYSVRGETRDPTTYFRPDDPARGAYLCNKAEYREYNPCDRAEGTDCTGQYCSEGGCYEIVPDRAPGQAFVTENLLQRILNPPSGCFNPSDCRDCYIAIPPIDLVGSLVGFEEIAMLEGVRNLRLCASRACACMVVGNRATRVLTCVKRGGLNASCASNEQCIGAYTCIIEPGKAGGRCENPRDYGETCYEDSDCMTGICGYETMYYRDVKECTGTSNTPCGIGDRCQPPLVCHDCIPPSSDTCAPRDYNPCVYGESPI